MKNWWNRNIDKLIYKGDKENPDTYSKGKFFVVSIIFFLAMNLVSLPFYVTTGTIFSKILQVIFYATLLLLLSIILIYPRFGQRILLANLFFLLGGIPNMYYTYTSTGGIYSPDNAFGIVLTVFIFLVTNKTSGLIWTVIGILSYVGYYYADVQGYHAFRADEIKLNADYFLGSWIFGIIFAVVVILLHESSKEKYLKDLKASKSEVEKKSNALEEQNKELEYQKREILSSIHYAKRIQYAVLPHEETIYRSIPLSFILYQPRDIVSGDFFWFHEIDEKNYIIVCADCTGHGVPGAFMTVIGSSSLNQIISENKTVSPSELIMELDKKVMIMLKQEKAKFDFV